MRCSACASESTTERPHTSGRNSSSLGTPDGGVFGQIATCIAAVGSLVLDGQREQWRSLVRSATAALMFALLAALLAAAGFGFVLMAFYVFAGDFVEPTIALFISGTAAFSFAWIAWWTSRTLLRIPRES